MSEAPQATIQKIRDRITGALQDLEVLEINLKPNPSTPTSTPASTPTQTPLTQPPAPTLNLDSLPWKTFASGKGSWIFSNLEDPPAKELVGKLTEAKGKLDLDGFTYKLSGNENQFVNRFHKKKES